MIVVDRSKKTTDIIDSNMGVWSSSTGSCKLCFFESPSPCGDDQGAKLVNNGQTTFEAVGP
jgi:hypothetical protein